jgi:membrane-associated phospholipid phosphatase
MPDTTTMRPPSEPTPGTEDEGPAAASSPVAAGASLTVACVLLGAVVVGGLILRLAPGQNAVDSWGFTLLPGVLQSTFLKTVTELGLAPVAGLLGLTAGFLAWRRDRLRALACVAGPGLAVLLSELLKIVVGRRLEHVLCYPSGTAAVVTAVACAFVLVTRGPARVLAVVVGTVAVVLEAVAVVKLRWHYPTDTGAGIALGAGSVMLVDAILHRWRRRSPLRPRP